MMEYILIGVAGLAVFFLIILLIVNRRQGNRIKRNIREIKKIQTGEKNYLDIFD